MKTKKVSRVLALLLSVVMLLGALPTAFAEEDVIVKDENYNLMLQAAMQEFYERSMSAEDLAALDAVSDEIARMQGEVFLAALPDDLRTALEARTAELIAEYEANRYPVEVDDRTVFYPTVDYIDVAPFNESVVNNRSVMMMKTSRIGVETADSDGNHVHMKKNIELDEDGKQWLVLETWTDGQQTIQVNTETKPTDIILVLDQSMSMTYDFSKVEFQKTSGTSAELYAKQDSLYVKRSDGGYEPVKVTREVEQKDSNFESFSGQTNATYEQNSKNFYHKCDNGQYHTITVSRSGSTGTRTYSYDCDGCEWSGTGTYTSIWWSGTDTPPDSSRFYRLSDSAIYKYTFSYTKEDGTEITVSDASELGVDLYEKRVTGTEERIDALKAAVTTFAEAVEEKSGVNTETTADDVNHRIAIIGFGNNEESSYGYNTPDPYEDTELLIGSTPYGYTNTAAPYDKAFQDMSDPNGVSNVKASISALSAEGYTFVNLGLELAQRVLEADTLKNDTNRNRVIVVFTDGVPGNNVSWNDASKEVGDAAFPMTDEFKAAGISVYTVGIFDGANPKVTGSWDDSATDNEKVNYYMHRMSSNMTDGTKNKDGYYLAASDSTALESIFKAISNEFSTGGAAKELSTSTIVRDVIADQFVLPDGEADTREVQVFTSSVDTATGAFGTLQPFTVQDAVKFGTNDKDQTTIDVSGFDFKANWVGEITKEGAATTYHGAKLVIKIPINLRDGFLGGNGVKTNEKGSGIYEDEEDVLANEPIEEFVSPTIDVPIQEITIAAKDKYVYLYHDLTKAQILDGVEIKSGGVALDPTQDNLGLEDWQKAYVNITLPENTSMENLWADTEYTISCTIEPKDTEGTATAQQEEVTKAINVYIPELTFKDGQVDYMSAIDAENYLYNNAEKTYTADNRVGSVVWKHGSDVLNNQTVMVGSEPTLALTYNLYGGVESNKVTAIDYVPVQVTVKIGDDDVTTYTSCVHQCSADSSCEWDGIENKTNGSPAFLLHVENVNGDLKITKTVNWNGKYDEAQTFLFKVEGKKVDNSSIDPIWVSISFTYSDGKTKSETIIVEDLPAGTYTVTEIPADQRYTMSAEGNTGMVVNGTVIPEAKFTNTLINDKWLDDEYSVDNIFNDVTTQESTN